MTATPKTVKDPVCGMEIDPGPAAGPSDYNGRTYYILRGCLQAKVRREAGAVCK